MPDGAAACLSARAAFLWVGRVRACVRACSAPPLAERASLVRRGMAMFARANLRRGTPGLRRPVRGAAIDNRGPRLSIARLVRASCACAACLAASTCLLLPATVVAVQFTAPAHNEHAHEAEAGLASDRWDA